MNAAWRRLALAALVGLGAGCGPGGPPADAPPNVVLVIVDTLRADRLGCYGGPRPTSPALDSLAASGTRFERAYAAAPWTLPSAASILTGLYPTSHGARTQRHRLSPAAVTLAEVLGASGYATAAVVSHVFVGSDHGLDQGYEVFQEGHARGHDYVSTEGVTDDALAVLDELAAGDRPFFLTVHYFDPHSDYEPHDHIDFAPPAAGRLVGGEPIEALRRFDPPLTEAEQQFVLAVYDEEIRHTDDGIARLLARLRERGVADRTVWVVTADHGEEFWEAGRVGHGRSLREPVMRVPLLFAGPGIAAGRVVPQPASHAAIAPTLVDLLDLPLEIGRQAGSLIGAMSAVSETLSWTPPVLESEFDSARPWFGIVEERWKLLFDSAEGIAELYDLESDPDESRRFEEERRSVAIEWFERLRDEMTLLQAERLPAEAAPPISPEREEQLRALGYAN